MKEEEEKLNGVALFFSVLVIINVVPAILFEVWTMKWIWNTFAIKSGWPLATMAMAAGPVLIIRCCSYHAYDFTRPLRDQNETINHMMIGVFKPYVRGGFIVGVAYLLSLLV